MARKISNAQSNDATANSEGGRRRNSVNLVDLAYEKTEALIVECSLKPGSLLSIQDLQTITGFSRTPVHQAVSRLAADTLINVQPRHGLQIAPIDLARDRMLLRLRRDLERFVIKLAAENAGPAHRNQMMHIARAMRDLRDTMTIEDFNMFDNRIDLLILSAGNEPFLVHTLRPLHTIFRRIGWLYLTHISGKIGLEHSVDCHLAVLDSVASRNAERAMEASDELIELVDNMFGELERDIDPTLLDCSFEPIITS